MPEWYRGVMPTATLLMSAFEPEEPGLTGRVAQGGGSVRFRTHNGDAARPRFDAERHQGHGGALAASIIVLIAGFGENSQLQVTVVWTIRGGANEESRTDV